VKRRNPSGSILKGVDSVRGGHTLLEELGEQGGDGKRSTKTGETLGADRVILDEHSVNRCLTPGELSMISRGENK